MIISGGENIASSEVERVIYELPQVREVAVIGVPDARWGKRPVAVVGLRTAWRWSLPDLTDHCRKRLRRSRYKTADHSRTGLPRNPSGKVLKRVLRAELETTQDAVPEYVSGKVTKLSRVERNAWTKRRIFDAATKIVGKYGYAEASVPASRTGGCAPRDIHNHFGNRQELLDQFCCRKIGLDMVRFYPERTGTAHAASRIIERFGAFFRFHPRGAGIFAHSQRSRIFCADRPTRNISHISTAYVRILRRARHAGADR